MWLDLFKDLGKRYWWVALLIVTITIGGVWLLSRQSNRVVVSGYQVSAEAAKASEYYLKGEIDKAEQQYQAIVKRHPDDWFSWNGLGNIYRDKDKLADAESAYLKAIKINPKFEQGYRNLYNIYYSWATKEAAKLQLSEPLLLAGLKIMPKSEMILEDLITYYSKVGDQTKLAQYRGQLAAIRQPQSQPKPGSMNPYVVR